MIAFIFSFISAYGWIILGSAICGAALATLMLAYRLNESFAGGILRAPAILAFFFWELVKKPRTLLHFVWLLVTAPFAIAIGLLMGILDFACHPFLSGKR